MYNSNTTLINLITNNCATLANIFTPQQQILSENIHNTYLSIYKNVEINIKIHNRRSLTQKSKISHSYIIKYSFWRTWPRSITTTIGSARLVPLS